MSWSCYIAKANYIFTNDINGNITTEASTSYEITYNPELNDSRKSICLRKFEIDVLKKKDFDGIEKLVEHGNTVCHAPIQRTS